MTTAFIETLRGLPVPEQRHAFYVDKSRREVRFGQDVNTMHTTQGDLVFDGYASLTDTPYTVSDWLGDYTETIARGAFAKTLAERDDVRLLVNHDGIPLARTRSGTLELTEDDRGLRAVATLDPDSPLVQTVRSAMLRGDLDQMSFAFRATRQEWNEDYTQRTIIEAKLFDTSVVTYPASPSTSAKLRSDVIFVPEPGPELPVTPADRANALRIARLRGGRF